MPGGYLIHPFEIKEGVVLGRMSLCKSWTYLEFELTCKKLDKSIKFGERFQNFDELRFPLTLTRRNCHIESSYFARIPIFLCIRINFLRLRLYTPYFNQLLFQGAKEEVGRRQGGNLNAD